MEIHIIIEHAELDLGCIITIVTGVIVPLARYWQKRIKQNRSIKINQRGLK